MKVKAVQIFDPIHHPGGIEYPARIEMAVEELGPIREAVTSDEYGLDRLVNGGSAWTLSWHANTLLLFSHPDEEVWTREHHDAEFGMADRVPHEGLLNVAGVMREPVFPITVAVADAEGIDSVWRDMWAPVSFVRSLLADHQPRPDLGEWILRPSEYWANKGQVVFELFFDPARAAGHASDARARAARKPRD